MVLALQPWSSRPFLAGETTVLRYGLALVATLPQALRGERVARLPAAAQPLASSNVRDIHKMVYVQNL